MKRPFESIGTEPNGALWDVLDRLGYPSSLAQLAHDFHANLVVRYKFAGFLGSKFGFQEGRRGAPQGDPLSMVYMNVIVVVWMAAVEHGLSLAVPSPGRVGDGVFRELECVLEHSPDVVAQDVALMAVPKGDARYGGYADDTHAASHDGNQVRRVHLLTVVWAYCFALKLSPTKSIAFGGVPLFVGAQRLPAGSGVKMLGDWAAIRDGDSCDPMLLPAKRLQSCRERLTRIANLPGTRDQRLSMIASCSIPTLYGSEFAELPQKDVYELRKEVWKAARAGKEPLATAALEMCMTFYAQGYLVGPLQCFD